MKKFEYKILHVTDHARDEDLNELGEQGWELVCAVQRNVAVQDFYFKREIQPSAIVHASVPKSPTFTTNTVITHDRAVTFDPDMSGAG